ncbi:MAG TPA: hypothetical protein VGQ90_07650 [Stellaceae bacterium]|nr:hypothetical protein [Stellaceae bacterium]
MHLAVDDVSQAGESGRAGAAGVAQRGDPGRAAEMVGVAAHVVRIDEDMRVDVDEPRRHIEPARADRAARLALRQRRRDLDDLAAADRDIEPALQPGAGIEHLAALDQEVVLHRLPSRSP